MFGEENLSGTIVLFLLSPHELPRQPDLAHFRRTYYCSSILDNEGHVLVWTIVLEGELRFENRKLNVNPEHITDLALVES